jgi:hypothetical protein
MKAIPTVVTVLTAAASQRSGAASEYNSVGALGGRGGEGGMGGRGEDAGCISDVEAAMPHNLAGYSYQTNGRFGRNDLLPNP